MKGLSQIAALPTSMLRTIQIKPAIEYPRHVDKDSIINWVGNGSLVDEVESQVDSQTKLFKFRNKVGPSLVKSQSSVKPSSKPGS